jgi:gliding motility-associated-like protein
MTRFSIVFKHVFTLLLLVVLQPQAKAEHIIGGDIYWECITTGPDAGKFEFYLKLYRDCSINTIVNPGNQVIEVWNDAIQLGVLPLTLISQTDVTPLGCGFTCSDQLPNISVEEYVFKSAPFAINITPGPSGIEVIYHRCCRNPVDNLQSAINEEIYYAATMYAFNGQNMNPCYDSSPQFAEEPTSLLCSGYELQYNSNAIDTDLDSLSYEFVPAQGNLGVPIAYAAGYSANLPLPGPTLNPTYDNVTINSVTGQIEYNAPPSVQGRWTMVLAVYGWRCGQRVSKTIREMSVTIIPCAEANNSPNVTSPAWTAPVGTSGYAVTVQAGDPVSFAITGTDNDIVGGNPQVMSFSASGSQFGTNFTNANAGCLNPPCATLTNVSPPTTGVGSISTLFNWQTTCDHVAVQDACGNYSNTYNFIFKFQDDFCPARASNFVSVTVTVVGEPIIESPKPHCASTAANGDITLSWEPVVDNNVPQSFVEYAIFHSTSASGPFTQEIGSVTNIGTGTYTHTSANPVVAPSTSSANYYVIRTRSGCNDAILEAPVDTIASIFLNVVDNITVANLSWNAVTTPNLPSANGIYEVWRLEPGGVWTNIASTTDLFYSDPVIWCNNELITYRIELPDNLPCTSTSNEVAENLDNPMQPDPQPIDSVSVDMITGLVTICWPPSTSLNVVQYNIFVNTNAFSWIPIDTVYGYNNTCWTDPNPNAGSQSLWYQVTATNTCDETGIPAGSIVDNTDHHESMYLRAHFDSCQKLTELFWNPYWYWAEGIREYEIYVSKNASPFVKVDVTNDTNYVHTNLEVSAEYCYVVRAVKNTTTRTTAASNKACIIAKVPKRPDYQYNYNTTVQAGNTGVEEFFFVDSTAGYIGFQIQRGTEPNDMRNLWFMPFDVSTRYYQYTDPSARPAFNSYYYWVIGVDSCELNADTMNMSRTILLDAVANSNRTNSLEWNAYEGWNGNVTAYNIHRSVDGVYAFLTTVPSTQLTYTDSIQEIIIGEGNFCYIIEAVEGISTPIGAPNPVLFQELSQSNEDCAHQHPNVFTPNAFMPEGVNNIFKPVTVYVDADSYLFQMYNRWGEKIFETTDPDQGWNGSAKGKPQPQGSYVFFVSFVSSKGKEYTKSGSVTLLR